MSRWIAFVLSLAVVVGFLAPSLFAEEKTPDKFALGFQGGILKGYTDFPESNFAFSGRLYGYPFRNEGTALKRFSFGVEIGRAVLATEPLDVGLRIQRQLWFVSPEARYDLFSSNRFRATVQGGAFGLRRDVLQYNASQYGGRGWQCYPQSYYGGCVSESSWTSLAHGGISLAFRLPRRDYRGDVAGGTAFTGEYVRYRGGFTRLSFGLEFSFK